MTFSSLRHSYRLAAAVVLCASVIFAQAWTDRAEYDLALALRTETAPARQLAMIGEWKQKYPNSGLKGERAELELSAAKESGDWRRALVAAKELSTVDPTNLAGVYWTAVLTPSLEQSKEAHAGAAEAAKKLLAAAATKPASLPQADWDQQKNHLAAVGHRVLGWIEWQKESFATAEPEFRAALDLNSADAEVSSWLGAVMAVQKAPEKQLQAIWQLARGAYLDGEDALQGAKRGDAKALLEAVYVTYHGSPEGLDAIGEAAKQSPQPPSQFRIETAAEAAIRLKDEELARTNPELASWLKIRRRMESADGAAYLTTLTTTPLLLKGFVVRGNPASRPKELGIAMSDPATEEIVLTLDAPLQKGFEPGTVIEFEATPVSMKADPFTLTMSAPKAKVNAVAK